MCGATGVKRLGLYRGDQQPYVPHKSTGPMSLFLFSCCFNHFNHLFTYLCLLPVFWV